MRSILILAAAALGTAAVPASAATVNFEGSSSGSFGQPLVFPGVSFTSPGTLFVISYDGSQQLCATPTGSTCASPVTLAFDMPVTGLTFTIDGVDNFTSTLSVLLGFSGGGTSTQTFTGFAAGKNLIDLSGFGNVASAVLSSSDTAGVSYDDFTFNSAVPEPATWATFIAGFGLIGGGLRRRRTSIAFA